MRDVLRPILSCALVVAVSAAVHGQLVGTKFEKYTRFLTAVILLSLLISPMLDLLHAGGELISPDSEEQSQTAQIGSTVPKLSYAEALFLVTQRKVEDDIRALLAREYGISADSILQVQVTMDGSDPQDIRVAAVSVRLREDADPAEIEKILEERYGCESVSVIVDA